MKDPQDGKQENPQQNAELPGPAGGDYPVADPAYPPTAPSWTVPAPGPGQPGAYPYPGGYSQVPPTYPGSYPPPGINQTAPIPPSYPAYSEFPPHSNLGQNPPDYSGTFAPYSPNTQFPSAPPQQKKSSKTTVKILLSLLILVLVLTLALGGVWIYKQRNSASLENGIVSKVTKTVVKINPDEMGNITDNDSPDNPLWYPLVVNEKYLLFIWPNFEADKLTGMGYQAISEEDGKKVDVKDIGITMSAGNGKILQKCADSQRYRITDKRLECATVKTGKRESFSVSRTGKTAGAKKGKKQGSPSAKDTGYSLSGETLGTVGDVRVVASPSALQTQAFFGVDADNNLLWTQTLKQVGRSVLSGENISVFNLQDDGKVIATIYTGTKKADKKTSSATGPTVAKDAIKKFDFANTQWSLPRAYSAPECQGDMQNKQLGCDKPKNYRLEDGRYRLNEKQQEQLLAALGGNAANYQVDDIFTLQAKSIDSSPGDDYAIEYGDVNGDGYIDAVIPVISMSAFNMGMDVLSTNYVWLMNPLTGVPEQLETPVYFADRCGEYYDHAEFSSSGPQPQLIVHTLTWADSPCCACGRDVPKKRSTWHYDAKRHDMVCEQDSGSKKGY